MRRTKFITSMHRTKKAAAARAKKADGGVVVKTPRWARSLQTYKNKPYAVKSHPGPKSGKL